MVFNMSMPLVSVIMPCYNNQEFVVASVQSVLSQDYPNIEVIVVDDGSTDLSLEKLAQFGDKITIISQANQGPAAARNTGMLAAKGEYIAFNDSDDLWLPGKLKAQISYMQKQPEIGLCFTDWRVWNGLTPIEEVIKQSHKDKIRVEVDPNQTGWLYIKLLEDSLVHTTTAIIKAEIIKTVGVFNTDYRVGEDYDYWLRISRQYQMAKLTNIYSLYRDNPTSITKKVHPHNFSLLVLESTIANFGLQCPSGDVISQQKIDYYRGIRNFNYGFQCFYAGHREKAYRAFRNCVGLQYRTFKSSLYALLSSNNFLYNQFKDRKS